MSRNSALLFHEALGGDGLTIVQLLPENAGRYADPILGVMATAYARGFEEEQELLPEGSSEAYFSELHGTQPARMERYMAGGSSYFVAHAGCLDYAPDNVVGVVKTSPSRASLAQKLHASKPNLYINDVAVSRSREGVGSALLLAATIHVEPTTTVATDVLPGSEDFFRAVGLKPVSKQPKAFSELEIGGVPLHEKMVRYGNRFVGTVKYSLSEQKPWVLEVDRMRAQIES